MPFQANVGQYDARVAYVAQTFAGALFVTRDGQLVHSFPGRPVAETDRGMGRKPFAQQREPGWTLTETLVNARPRPRGGPASATHVSRFIGNDPTRWHSDVPTFDRVSLGEAWPGIDVELAARGNNVEKLFTVAPGADARRIAIRLRGAKRLEVTADGTLIAHTGNGPVSFTAPAAWQDIDGRRRPVSVAYALAGQRYGFTLGDYDHAQPVVIDPLLQATYLGGARVEEAFGALVLDPGGNVFVAGSTNSFAFPGTAGGAQAARGGFDDAFIAKLNNGLTALTQATYLGGSGPDRAYALALDAGGNVFVAGFTGSVDFPGTTGGVRAAPGGMGDAFHRQAEQWAHDARPGDVLRRQCARLGLRLGAGRRGQCIRGGAHRFRRLTRNGGRSASRARRNGRRVHRQAEQWTDNADAGDVPGRQWARGRHRV